MCVALPGRVISITRGVEPSIPALMETGSTTVEIDLVMCPDATVGDYVVAHSGFALRIVAEGEVGEVRRLLDSAQPPSAAQDEPAASSAKAASES